MKAKIIALAAIAAVSFAAASNPAQARSNATGNMTFYVAPSGNDANNCTSLLTACATPQGAMNVIANNWDGMGFTATMSLTKATYTKATGTDVLGILNTVGFSSLTINGNGSTLPGGTAQDAIDNLQPFTEVVHLENLVVGTYGSKAGWCGVMVQSYGVMYVDGGMTIQQACAIDSGAILVLNGPAITFAGGGTGAIVAGIDGEVWMAGPTITVTGDPNFSTGFAVAFNNGTIYMTARGSISGAATGYRYNAYGNGSINTQGAGPNYFPGSLPGVTSSGGVYE